MACKFHRHLADRDVHTYLRASGLVNQRHFLEIYPEMRDIRINVPRTDGSITAGGNLSEEPWEFVQKSDGAWMIKVLFKESTGEIKNKLVKLKDFDKSGASEEDIDEWLTTLDGFYRGHEIENMAARENGHEKGYSEPPGIVNAVSNGIMGRVFIPQ
jgi:hypothetical protein